jgi:hypothetical protein
LSVHNVVVCHCWHFKFFQSMILKFEPLGLDDRRQSLDNSTHCLNEGVSVLNACYSCTWFDCLLWLHVEHLVYLLILNALPTYVTQFISVDHTAACFRRTLWLWVISSGCGLEQTFGSFRLIKNYSFVCFLWVLNAVLTWREENTFRIHDNTVLRKTFGPKREEVTRHWRILHKEELHYLYISLCTYYSGDQLKEDKMGGSCCMWGGEEMHKGFSEETWRKETTWKT